MKGALCQKSWGIFNISLQSPKVDTGLTDIEHPIPSSLLDDAYSRDTEMTIKGSLAFMKPDSKFL